MELHNQIKKYRTAMGISQEQLAEKVYVTRQTVSNWENDKSYPDIHSLLLLSSLFEISLDQLIKGDIEIMKEQIKKSEVEKHNHYGNVFSAIFILCLIAFVPLIKFFKIYGAIIWGIVYGIGLVYAFKINKIQKDNDIATYKEVVAFSEGKMLDEIEKKEENKKRIYQPIIKMLFGAGVAFAVIGIMMLIFGGL